MRIIVDNVFCELVIGGKDNLLPINLYKEIDSYLAVKQPGSFWAKKKGSRGWDGMRHFLVSNKFPTGFLPAVISLAEELGADIQIIDQRKNFPEFKEEFESSYGPHEPREYQNNFVKKANNYFEWSGGKVYFPRGVFDAATNAGKNMVAIGILKNLKSYKCIFLLHSKFIYSQAVEYFKDFLDVGEINDKKYRITDFTIAMVGSLASKAEKSINVLKDLSGFNVLIVDEGHKAGGAEYNKLLKKISAGARYMISGTPLDNDNPINNLIVVGQSGPVLGKITNKELIDQGVSMRPIVEIHYNNTPSKFPLLTYDEEVSHCIFYSKVRNQIIYDLVKNNPDKQILICFNDIEHGETIYDTIKSIGSVEWVHGKDPGRSWKIKDFAAAKFRVLITSTILKEGANISNIQMMIYAIAGKAKITVKQFVGRLVRNNHDGETTVALHDFYDEGKHIAAHSRKRIRLYKAEQFEVIETYKDAKSKKRKSTLSGN